MTARSTCRYKCWALVVLVLGLLVAWSCGPTGEVATSTAPPHTPRPTSEATATPDWTRILPSPMPTFTPTPTLTLTPTPLALSWVGPLLVPVKLPTSSDGTTILTPIFDAGSGQSVPFPLQGFREGISVEGWSPEGCFLIMAGEPEYLVNIETGIVQPSVSDAPQTIFSPDGKWKAYRLSIRLESGLDRYWVYVAHTDGSAPPSLLAEGEVWLSGWSDDSRKVLYGIQREELPDREIWERYAVDIDSLEQCLIARVPKPLERWEDLYLADVASCEQIPLALSGSLETDYWVSVGYAPGHRHLTLGLYPARHFFLGPSVLFVLDVETGQAHPVGGEDDRMFDPLAWSPDGTRLVLVGDLSEGDGVYLLEAVTGQRRKLDVLGFEPAWSPDGRYLALQAHGVGSFLYDLETETTIHLPAEFGPVEHPQQQRLLWSPRASYGEGACR